MGIAHQDQTFYVGEGINQSGQLFLGQHRAFVDDNSPEVAATRCSSIWEIGLRLPIVSTVAVEELGKGPSRTPLAGLLLEPHARLASGGEEQDAFSRYFP